MTESEDIKRLYRRVEQLDTELKEMKEEARDREEKRLRWGITALGTALIVLGSWAWAQVSDLVSISIGRDQ